MRLDEQIQIIEAFKEGKEVQCRSPGLEWHNLTTGHLFNFAHLEYRVVEPPRDFWIAMNTTGDIYEVFTKPKIVAGRPGMQIIHVREVKE